MTEPITACRSCWSTGLTDVLDLGDQYLSDFRDDDTRPPRSPLQLVVCDACTLAQLRHTAPAEQLYHPRYSFKSGVSDAIRADLESVVTYARNQLRWTPFRWLDIASNDGTLLAQVPAGIYRAGIDPLEQFSYEAYAHADRIVTDFFDPGHFTPGEFDVITSVSMFYDVPDPNGFVAGVAKVLADDGIWVIQQNYLPAMLAAGSVDNISHEHLAYYSLTSLIPLLKRHGFEVNDVRLNPVNGGCFRTLVTRAGARPPTDSVVEHLRREAYLRVDRTSTYAAFTARVRRTLADLADLVHDINARGERVYVYGASTRGAVIWQAAGLDVHHLPKVVDRNPDKVGRFMSAIGAPIISEEQARAERPEWMLVGPWWFRDQFVERERDYLAGGGRLIFPLPELEVVGA